MAEMVSTSHTSEVREPIRARPLRRVAALRGIVGSTIISVGLSLLITGAMSWLFHGRLRADMMATGFVAGAAVNLIVFGIVRRYRRRLRDANEALEQKVAERTAALSEANDALVADMNRRAALQERLMVVDRMATAGQLAAGISHEIRNPLAAIVANLSFVRSALNAEGPGREAIDDIAEAAKRVEQLSNDLTTLSRPSTDPIGTVELGPVVALAARLAAHELRRGSLEVADDLPRVIGNASRLCQVFLNLFINAAKATRSEAPNVVLVDAVDGGDFVTITVSDTGCGMDPGNLERVWEPFFTTRLQSGGTGLGMPMVRSIVEALGGRVGIESTRGQGTVVSIDLPSATQ
jgi:two-component system, NtrC family, sensor kinase